MTQGMTPQDFVTRASAALGGRGWQGILARAIGVTPSTIRRWGTGETPLPAYAVAVLELLEQCPAAFRPARWGKR